MHRSLWFITLFGLALLSTAYPVAAQQTGTPCDAPTVITADTTLGPSTCEQYIAQNGIVVTGGATLTIEPGTTIRFGRQKGLLLKQSSIIARGSPDQPITFTSNKAMPSPGNWLGISIDLGYDTPVIPVSFQHVVIEYAGGADAEGNYLGSVGSALLIEGEQPTDAPPVEIDHSILQYNDGIAIQARNDFIALSITTNQIKANNQGAINCHVTKTINISENTITDNQGMIISADSASALIFTANTIANNNSTSQPVIQTATGSGQAEFTITDNLIYGNTGSHPVFWLSARAFTFKHNTIANNAGGGLHVDYVSPDQFVLTENSFFGNIAEGLPRDLENANSSGTLNLQNNYWGVTSESEIEERVWHVADDTSLGTVIYTPFLKEPPAEAPPLPQDATAPSIVDPNLPTLVKQNSDAYNLVDFEQDLLLGDWLLAQSGADLLTFHSSGLAEYLSPLLAFVRHDRYVVNNNHIVLQCLPDSTSCMWWDSLDAPVVELDAYIMRSKADAQSYLLVLVSTSSNKQIAYLKSSQTEATAITLKPTPLPSPASAENTPTGERAPTPATNPTAISELSSPEIAPSAGQPSVMNNEVPSVTATPTSDVLPAGLPNYTLWVWALAGLLVVGVIGFLLGRRVATTGKHKDQ